MEWKARISTVALRTLDDSKFNRVTMLPITDDLLKIRTYIKDQIPKLTAALHESKSLDDWRSLAEVLGVRLSIFNRRRGNEVYQMLVTKFEDRNKRKDAEIKEIKDSLSPLEIRLMERLVAFFINICYYFMLQRIFWFNRGSLNLSHVRSFIHICLSVPYDARFCTD